MKRVIGRSRLTFRCHNATNIRNRERGRERERERERERQSETYKVVLISNDKNKKVRMHENA